MELLTAKRTRATKEIWWKAALSAPGDLVPTVTARERHSCVLEELIGFIHEAMRIFDGATERKREDRSETVSLFLVRLAETFP